MFERAKQLRLPASFVDLRHEATHVELPSLPILRQAVKKGLDWLWFDFWCHQCPPKRTLSILAEVPRLRQELERFTELALIEPEAQAQSRLDQRAMETCLELVKVCKGEETLLAELARIIIEWGFMVPDSEHHE